MQIYICKYVSMQVYKYTKYKNVGTGVWKVVFTFNPDFHVICNSFAYLRT